MTTTIDSLKAQLIAYLDSREGTLITVSEKATQQTQEYLEELKRVTQYDPANVTPDDLEMAQMLIDAFTTDRLTGDVVDDVLQPVSDVVHDLCVRSLSDLVVDTTCCHYLAAFIIGDVMVERKYFNRK